MPEQSDISNLAITWKHRCCDFPQPLRLDDKITIFEEQIYGWQLHTADLILNGGQHHDGSTSVSNIPHAAFAALQVLLSYFELISKYHDGYCGQDKSAEHFKKGFHLVFPGLIAFHPDIVDRVLKVLYSGLRCGLYHGFSMGRDIILSGEPDAALFVPPHSDTLWINPHKWPQAMKAHLKGYCECLRNESNRTLRANFEKRYDHDNG